MHRDCYVDVSIPVQLSYYNDNLMILIECLATIGYRLEGFRRPKWAQMKAELSLQIVLIFFSIASYALPFTTVVDIIYVDLRVSEGPNGLK